MQPNAHKPFPKLLTAAATTGAAFLCVAGLAELLESPSRLPDVEARESFTADRIRERAQLFVNSNEISGQVDGDGLELHYTTLTVRYHHQSSHESTGHTFVEFGDLAKEGDKQPPLSFERNGRAGDFIIAPHAPPHLEPGEQGVVTLTIAGDGMVELQAQWYYEQSINGAIRLSPIPMDTL